MLWRFSIRTVNVLEDRGERLAQTADHFLSVVCSRQIHLRRQCLVIALLNYREFVLRFISVEAYNAWKECIAIFSAPTSMSLHCLRMPIIYLRQRFDVCCCGQYSHSNGMTSIIKCSTFILGLHGSQERTVSDLRLTQGFEKILGSSIPSSSTAPKPTVSTILCLGLTPFLIFPRACWKSQSYANEILGSSTGSCLIFSRTRCRQGHTTLFCGIQNSQYRST